MRKLLFLLFLIPCFSLAEPIVRCGVATGFPPYQYVNDKGEITGIDVEIAKLVFKTAGIKVVFIAGEWDFFISSLAHNTDTIDMLVGAEFNERRAQFMDFSLPLHLRRTTLFVLKDSNYNNIENLYGKIVAGDQDSMYEKNLQKKRTT
jgi:ABC-type amino acid transport substrate-binding protein